MRKATLYLTGTAFSCALLVSMIWTHRSLSEEDATRRILAERRIVDRFELTDICLFTEAPHTRHMNMADRFEPFRSHPSAAPHFPSESYLVPPDQLTHEAIPPSEEEIQ